VTDALSRLLAKDAVHDVITSLFVETDERNWEAVRACFAPYVLFDMSSLTGAEPARLAAEAIVEGWRAGLAAITAVHHQIGNLRIEVGDGEASAFCYGTATHFRKTASGRDTRTFVGTYDFHLTHDKPIWTVDLFRFKVKYVDGNLDLEKG
jgi:hypothetical protein